MKRAHRLWHRRVWLVLPVLLAVVLAAAWWLQPPAPAASALPPALNNAPVEKP